MTQGAAAGWFKNLEWRDGQGLFATDVEWTPAAAKAIADHEYRFISPVFRFDPQTGDVQQIYMAALTNNPGLDGMQSVALSAFLSSQKEPPMNKLLEALLAQLGLSTQTPDDQALAALNAHFVKAKSDADQVAALTTAHTVKDAQIAALKLGSTPDPAKFVPITVVTDLQGQIAALSTQINGREVEQTVAAALSNGQLLPAQEAWARELGNKDLAALRSFIATAPKIAALTAQQNGGRAPETAPQGAEGLDAATLAVCRQMGINPVAVAKAKGAAQ
ncbi:phage protease [Paludibacterium yongneupense]|uniref:phage protease n=1 Tax=Paludibacterium yongneupense TaxID=400061 RepID=UPI002484B050|nr:phage protease [Paludibacterium yongneupense]